MGRDRRKWRAEAALLLRLVMREQLLLVVELSVVHVSGEICGRRGGRRRRGRQRWWRVRRHFGERRPGDGLRGLQRPRSSLAQIVRRHQERHVEAPLLRPLMQRDHGRGQRRLHRLRDAGGHWRRVPRRRRRGRGRRHVSVLVDVHCHSAKLVVICNRHNN